MEMMKRLLVKMVNWIILKVYKTKRGIKTWNLK